MFQLPKIVKHMVGPALGAVGLGNFGTIASALATGSDLRAPSGPEDLYFEKDEGGNLYLNGEMTTFEQAQEALAKFAANS